MTDSELDGKVQMDESRIIRVAKGAGVHPQEVVALLDTYKQFEKMIDGMNKGGLLKGGDSAFQSKMMRNPNAVLSQMQKSMDPRMLANMGGMQNLANMMKGLAKGACARRALHGPWGARASRAGWLAQSAVIGHACQPALTPSPRSPRRAPSLLPPRAGDMGDLMKQLGGAGGGKMKDLMKNMGLPGM